MICKTSHIRCKIFSVLANFQSGVFARAGTAGKDPANFRNEVTLLENRF